MRVAVVGATGAVGLRILSVLEDRAFSIDELVPIASSRSVGRLLPFRGERVEVVGLARESFDGVDLALFDVPDEVALEWVPVATGRGAVVVDNSAAWRMHPDVPLVVPEVNPAEATRAPKRIIASPNCTTLTAVVPLAALSAVVPLTRLVLASYQAASGSGRGGIDELWEQTLTSADSEDAITAGLGRDVLKAGAVYDHPISMNVIPRCGSVADEGYTSEELKLCYETRKIMSLPDLPVTATCVRVPVMVGHSVAVHAEFAEPISVDAARAVLETSPGVEVRDDLEAGIYPTPLEAAGRDPCYVGRIRRDLWHPTGLEMFCASDNLRKGAALNTVQIAELLFA